MDLPRPRTSYRPDFNARETDAGQGSLPVEYYESKNILGQLYRAVQVPSPTIAAAPLTRQHPRWTPLQTNAPPTPLHTALLHLLATLPLSIPARTEDIRTSIKKIASHFIAELAAIAAFHTLSHRVGEKLSEGEVFVGAILAATSDPKLRRQGMIDMGDRTKGLVDLTNRSVKQRAESEVEEDGSREELLRWWVCVAWAGWEEGERRRREGEFGAESFSWVMLGTLLDLVEEIRDKF